MIALPHLRGLPKPGDSATFGEQRKPLGNDYPKRLVYFIRPIGQDGPIKIGSSRWPEDRLATYMRWSPYPLEIVVSVPGTMKTEMAIHRCFATARSHEEWFRPIPRLLAAIERLIAGAPLEEVIAQQRLAAKRLSGDAEAAE
jgi:hypothetical protein